MNTAAAVLRFQNSDLSNPEETEDCQTAEVHTMNDNKTPLQVFDPRGFGRRLQSARKALGITQEELAESLCVGRNHITRMERGIRVCSIDLLVEISALLSVTTDYLLVGTATGGTAKAETALNH